MEGVDRDTLPVGMPENDDQEIELHQSAIIICEATVSFCERFIVRRSRTVAQMVDASRGAMRYIAEGGRTVAVSPPAGLPLFRAARVRLEELLIYYQDFLRLRGLPMWGEEHPQATAIRKLACRSARSYGVYRTFVQSSPPETAANALVGLIRQALRLLGRQLEQLAAEQEEDLTVPEGGDPVTMASAVDKAGPQP
jgi:hypothetical protein